MDNNSEDKIVKQIEKSLSNNINENLFLSGRSYENERPLMKGNNALVPAEEPKRFETEKEEYPLYSYDYISDSQSTMTRAEYIRQAREACLRQLSNTQIYSRPYDVNYMEAEAPPSEPVVSKKAKAWKLFQEETIPSNLSKGEDTPQEIASFRGLIIRTICAIVLFVSVFIFDKLEMSIGKFSPQIIQAYITGNDSLQQLENFFVAWLK